MNNIYFHMPVILTYVLASVVYCNFLPHHQLVPMQDPEIVQCNAFILLCFDLQVKFWNAIKQK